VGGGRFGQDFKNSGKTSRYVWAGFLKQNHRPAKLSYSFSSKRRKNLDELKIFPPKAQVPVCLWQWRPQKIFMGDSFSGTWWSFVFGVRCF